MSTSSNIMLAFVLSTLLLGGNVALGKPADSRRARVARQVADPRRMPVPYSQTGTDLWGLDVIIQTADGNTDTAPAVGPNCNPVLEAKYGCKKHQEGGDWIYQCKGSEADSKPHWTLVEECQLGEKCSGSNAATSYECKTA